MDKFQKEIHILQDKLSSIKGQLVWIENKIEKLNNALLIMRSKDDKPK